MAEDDNTIAVEARITGRVQGVSFRFWTQDEARRLGVAGWVQNEPDGSVRAVFAGPRERVEAMLGRCREGPPPARVEAVETGEAAPPEHDDFRIVG